ncbi:hypothetical protein OQA88_2020 [Cercophora sp. LCS_1]
MELMHHYSTVVYATFTCDPIIQPMFQARVARVALKCDYLLKTILAITALHMARSKSDKKEKDIYLATALDYYQNALQQATPLLLNLQEGDEEVLNLYFFSSFTIIYVLGSPPQETPTPADPLFGATLFPEWLFLIRGTKSIRPMVVEWDDELKIMFATYGERWVATHPKELPPSRDQDALDTLVGLLKDSVHDETKLDIYVRTVNHMRGIYHIIAFKPHGYVDLSDLFTWIYEVNEDFFPLLEMPTQEALAVFAYFCVLFKRSEFHFWLEGWADRLIRRVKGLVDREHEGWIAWPVEEIERAGGCGIAMDTR